MKSNLKTVNAKTLATSQDLQSRLNDLDLSSRSLSRKINDLLQAVDVTPLAHNSDWLLLTSSIARLLARMKFTKWSWKKTSGARILTGKNGSSTSRQSTGLKRTEPHSTIKAGVKSKPPKHSVSTPPAPSTTPLKLLNDFDAERTMQSGN